MDPQPNENPATGGGSGPACVFCRIAAGAVPAQVVLADEVAVAFLDARPVFKGHVLVIPARHVETLADLPGEAVGPYFARVQAISRAVEKGLGADGSFVAMNNRISQSVPHLHTHVVPRRRKDGLRGFFWPRVKYDGDTEAESYAGRIREALDGGPLE
ncbi:HIT family protein [Sphaerisporangium perillae]|uniref:HIT family protein n=1 Tax=Sphaerisporangium perillae TaxID=2935860 RepID=UPI00200F089E|nr:HIT family protein [Sphaerisporangium perillae]